MLQFTDVQKHYTTGSVLDGATFRVEAGERVGLIGANGSGKSTILRIIDGSDVQDKGDVQVSQRTTVGFVRQQPEPTHADQSLLDFVLDGMEQLNRLEAQIAAAEAKPDQSPQLLEQIGELQSRFEALGGYDSEHRAGTALCGIGFAADGLNRPFRTFSGGWRMRAELVRTLLAGPDLLLLDEPTNYLDMPAIHWLREYLNQFSGSFILVSHDRYLLNSLANITLAVDNGRVRRHAGNYDSYCAWLKLHSEQQLKAKTAQDKKIDQIEAFAARFGAKNTKATAVKSRLKQIDRMERVQLDSSSAVRVQIALPPPPHSGREMLRLNGVGKTYDSRTWIFRDLSQTVERGDKVAILGANGLGKSTLLKVMAGELACEEGVRESGHQVVVGYMPQDLADSLDPDLTVMEIARSHSSDRNDGEIRSLLGAFGFTGDDIEKDVGVLSGGERVRLAFNLMLQGQPNLLLLDEPTTHLDIATRESLQAALAAYEGTYCLVSHDIEFVRNTAERVIELTASGPQVYYGDYDYYIGKKAENTASESGASAKSSGRNDRKARKREAAEQRKRLNSARKPLVDKVAKLESEIDELEQEQAKIVDDIQNGVVAGAQMADVNRRLAEIAGLIESKTADWEQAAEELEALEAEFSGE